MNSGEQPTRQNLLITLVPLRQGLIINITPQLHHHITKMIIIKQLQHKNHTQQKIHIILIIITRISIQLPQKTHTILSIKQQPKVLTITNIQHLKQRKMFMQTITAGFQVQPKIPIKTIIINMQQLKIHINHTQLLSHIRRKKLVSPALLEEENQLTKSF